MITALKKPLSWIVLYLLFHVLIRLLFSTTLQVDDAEQIRHAQHLFSGHPIPQPPLYSWLSWGLFKIFGTGLFALTLLKYTLIALTFWLTWLVSGQLFQHLQTRYIATFSYLLMPSFAWHMHQGFTHTILLGLGIILTLHALLSLKENNSIGHYLYFGLALGIGLMSKYSFLLFLIPLFVSAVSISSFRNLIVNQKIFLAIAVFILMIGPHTYWLIQHYQEIFSSIDQKLKVTSDNLLLDRIKSAGQFTVATIIFIMPFALIFIINSWKRLFNTDKQVITDDLTLLLNRFYLIIIVSVLTLTIFVSMPHFKVRWFHPLMMIFPLWMLARIERKELLSKSIMRWFAGITIIFTILIFSIRIAQVTIGPELGIYGRLNSPVIETLNKLPDHLIKNSAIKTQDEFLGAHLLSIYQNNNIIINGIFYQNSVTLDNDKCLLLWDDDESFSEPSATQNLESGELVTMTENKKYTLFYVVSPKQECN